MKIEIWMDSSMVSKLVHGKERMSVHLFVNTLVNA